MDEIKFLTCGDCAVTVAFAQEIREDTNRKIRYLAERLQKAGIHGLLETVPTYCSLTVYYEPLVLPRRKLEKLIAHQLSAYRADTVENKRVFEIPVCYEGEFAPDMADVCQLTGLSREQVIALHSGTDYLIYMLGFLPGFPYLGGMNPQLECPRLDSPRTRIPPGAVGIGGKQTGIYSFDPSLILLGLSGSEMLKQAKEIGLPYAAEVFADRAYEDDGTLVARSKPGAMITDEDEAVARVIRMILEHKVTSINGKEIEICPDSVCVHGDSPKALLFVKKIRAALEAEGITIQPLR